MKTKSPAVKPTASTAKELRFQRKMLRAYEAQCRAMFELMPGSMILLDATGVVRDANPAFCRNIGYTRNEILGKHISRFAKESPAVIKKNIGRLLAGEQLHHEVTNVQKDGSLRYYELHETAVNLPDGSRRILAVSNDITERKASEAQREKLIEELKQALVHVKTLRGLLPICASCKKIRDGGGYWNKLETYISQHSDASFTHGLCPDCAIKTFEQEGIKVPEGFLKKYGRSGAA